MWHVVAAVLQCGNAEIVACGVGSSVAVCGATQTGLCTQSVAVTHRALQQVPSHHDLSPMMALIRSRTGQAWTVFSGPSLVLDQMSWLLIESTIDIATKIPCNFEHQLYGVYIIVSHSDDSKN